MRLVAIAFALGAMGTAGAALREIPRNATITRVIAPRIELEPEPELPARSAEQVPFGLVAPAPAADPMAGLEGFVTRDGRPVVGLEITLSRDDSFPYKTVTDGNGRFALKVPPGDYTVQTSQPWSLDWRSERLSFSRGERLVGFEVELGRAAPPPAYAIETPPADLVDTVDRCPDQPEVENGFEDNDGCPDRVDITPRETNKLVYF
jgi:hypothetical protein